MSLIFAFINIFLQLLSFAIIVRVILSWIKVDQASKLYLFIRDVTEPVLGFFQKIIPRIGMIDISPLVALIAIDLVRNLLVNLIVN